MKYLLLLLLTTQCILLKAQNHVSYIKMERTACKAGRCPVYKIRLHRSGYIEYEGKWKTPRKGIFKSQMKKADAARIFKEWEKQSLKTLEKNYTPVSENATHLNFLFQLNGKNILIRNAEAGPDFLNRLAKMLDDQSKKLLWEKTKFIAPMIAETEEDPPPQVWEIDNGNAGTVEMNVDPGAVTGDRDVFETVDEMPEFPGGEEALIVYVQKNIKYPRMALDSNIQGKVIGSFIINEAGVVTQVKIEQGIGYGCDDETRRLIRGMPRWKPGKQKGRTVKVMFRLPINFRLED